MLLPHHRPLHPSTNMAVDVKREKKISLFQFTLAAVNTEKTVKAIRIMLRRDFLHNKLSPYSIITAAITQDVSLSCHLCGQ